MNKKEINIGEHKNDELDEILLRLDPRGGTKMINHLADKRKSIKMCNYLANSGFIELIDKDVDNKFSAKLTPLGIEKRNRGGFTEDESEQKQEKRSRKFERFTKYFNWLKFFIP